MNLDLRPLTLGELIDRAISLYRRNLWLFVGITAIPSVFGLAMTILFQMMQRVMLTSAAAGPNADVDPSMLVTILGMFAAIFALGILGWIVYMIALGATTHAVSELYVGRPSTVGAAYGQMKSRVGALIVLMLLIGLRVLGLLFVGGVALALSAGAGALVHPVISALIMLAGVLLIALGWLFMVLRYGMAVPALVVEGLGAGDAIKRSVALSRGRLGRVFLLVLCSLMVTYAAMLIFQVPFAVAAMLSGPESLMGFWLNIAGAVTGTIGTTFTTPFMVIGLALLYYDSRIREEGFDIELSLQALEATDAHRGVAHV